MARLSREDREAVAQVGEPAEIRERIAAYTHVQTQLASRAKALVKQYPKQWVAMRNNKVVCRGRSLTQLVAKCDRKGISHSDVAVRYLDTEKRIMVL